MTPKLKKAHIIAEIFEAIAKHCGSDAYQMRAESYNRSDTLQHARGMACYYLYREGMSYDAIARIFGRSVDRIRRLVNQCGTRLSQSDKSMLEELPRVPTTIKVSSENAKEHPTT